MTRLLACFVVFSGMLLSQGGVTVSPGGVGTVAAGNPKAAVVQVAFTTKTSNYTIGNYDYMVNCSSGTFAVTLPSAVGRTGRQYLIKNSGSGLITINTTASQTIDADVSGAITLSQWDALLVVSNGSNWLII
jgi:hypothetical protein